MTETTTFPAGTEVEFASTSAAVFAPTHGCVTECADTPAGKVAVAIPTYHSWLGECREIRFIDPARLTRREG